MIGKNGEGNSEPFVSLFLSASRSWIFVAPIDFVVAGEADGAGCPVGAVATGVAKKDAAIVLKSGVAVPEFVELASRKSAGDTLPAAITVLFAPVADCDAFTGTVFLARQICTS